MRVIVRIRVARLVRIFRVAWLRDLSRVVIDLCAILPADGGAPPFAVVIIGLLMWSDPLFRLTCLWPGSRADILRHLLAVRTWPTLFDLSRLPSSSD